MRLVETQHLLIRLSNVSEYHHYYLKASQNALDTNAMSLKHSVRQRRRRTNKLHQKVNGRIVSLKTEQSLTRLASKTKGATSNQDNPVTGTLGFYLDMKL